MASIKKDKVMQDILPTPPEFSKCLAKYYHTWFRDSHDSRVWCEENGNGVRALEYYRDTLKYFDIIVNNWDAIEFFSVDDNAFKYDWALPEQFRGYK